MKIYCIELERGGIGEEDMILHHGFEKEPTRQEVLDYVMKQDVGFDEKHCRLTFYHVADEAKASRTDLVPSIQLTPFEQTKETLTALASDYKNMVVTKENLKEANEARLVLYRKRIEIQNVAKANRKTIKDFLKNNNDAIETELIEVIEPTELALEDKIKKVKDAIAEEERLERDRIEKHKGFLNAIKDKITEATNSNNELHLKTIIEATVLTDLEEFTAEGEQLLSTLKETAKNRLELLEFQAAKKKADEDAEAKKIADEENAKKEAEEKELQQGFDMAEPLAAFEATPSETFEPNETPKLSPLKTVPIGVVSPPQQQTDKELLLLLSEEIKKVEFPFCDSKEAKQHVEYLRNMLSKLSEQTLKVAEKL